MKKELSTLINLDFDQFGRIYAAKNSIEGIRKKNEKFKILDVGGYKGNTAKLFPEDKVTIVDQYNIKSKNYVQANALALPFKDNEFDIVVSFDVLEHILPNDRPVFLSELTRVAKLTTIIAAPFKRTLVERAELLTNNFYYDLTGKNHPWLIEHIDNTLPESKIVDSFLKKNKLKYTVVQNNDIVLWNYLQHYRLLAVLGIETEIFDETNLFYNRHFDELEDLSQESYRKIYIIGKSRVSKTGVSNYEKKIETQLLLTDNIFRGISKIIQEKNQIIHKQAKLISKLEKNLKLVDNSLSWKITKPLREARNLTKKKK